MAICAGVPFADFGYFDASDFRASPGERGRPGGFFPGASASRRRIRRDVLVLNSYTRWGLESLINL